MPQPLQHSIHQRYSKIIAPLVLSILLASTGCSTSTNSDTGLGVEGAGVADYYLTNQTETPLQAVYRIAGVATDSLKDIPADSSVRLLRDSVIGGNPQPQLSIDRIWLYTCSPETSAAVLRIDPVRNEAWNIIFEQPFDDSTVGFRVFELIIRDGDF